MYFYCESLYILIFSLCILIFSLCILIVSLCILIVRLCILIVSLCIFIVSLCILILLVYVFLSLSMCCLCILRRGYPDWGFSVLFPQLYGKCQGITRQDGARPTLSQIVVLFYVLFVLCRSVYCLCVNVYCTTATGWQPNCSYKYISKNIGYTSPTPGTTGCSVRISQYTRTRPTT